MATNDETYVQEEDNVELQLEEVSDTSIRYEDSNDADTTQISQSEETFEGTLETSQTSKPKILIQRVFHQAENHVVEQKVDYVIANTEEEITKHVYGGLFRNKYYKYAPDSYCKKHAPDLNEHQDETLVKLGDKFDSQESFRLYVDGNAKQWKYYLKCADSHRKNGKETFVFKCVFARQRNLHSAAKGLRKRTFAVPRGDCPCRVILKPVPYNAKDLTVIYVCNHHDHPLTDEYFYKLQHGRRIHPSIKAELMDLLSLEVDREVVKKYFEQLTGYSMSFTFFQNMLMSMKKNKIERQFSLEKLKEMSKKIEKIKEELGMKNNDEEENVDIDLISDDNAKKDKASQVAEVFHVLKTVSASKKTPQKSRLRRINPELGPTPIRKRLKKQDLTDVKSIEPVLKSQQIVNNKSRLETRLQELKHDRETLQSIKHLQDSVRCETEKNPWIIEDVVAEPSNRIPLGSKAKRARNSQKQSPISKPMEIEPQAIVIENTQQELAYVENQDIVYENEITVMDTTENCSETIVNCVNIGENEEIVHCGNDIDLNDNNVSYCIPYDDGDQTGDQSEQQFVLMLADVESFENLPEVQIQATEFATVSIVSEDHQKNAPTGVPEAMQQVSANATEGNINNNDSLYAAPDGSLQETNQISVINQSGCEGTEIEENTVYEVIQTNDRKILPSKEIVHSVILNKPPKCIRRVRDSDQNKEKNVHQMSRKSKKTDVISQYFQEKMENYMFDMFREDLESLDDDECYMIVVNDEESIVNNTQDSPAGLEADERKTVKKERQNLTRSPQIITTNNDTISCSSENVKYINLENSNEFNNTVTNNDQGRNTVEDSVRYEVDVSECTDPCLDSIVQSENELLDLKKAIDHLKSQKHALEKDVEHLIATKDDLIEDITKAARLSRRMFK